jgi:hypothetical protein
MSPALIPIYTPHDLEELVNVSGWVLFLFCFGVAGGISVNFQDVNINIHSILICFEHVAVAWEV